ncbi:unnamed protein product [Meganyctiphanes norvegica]|uniref:Uncharacterized protein n=1 Tax=Meganyctiphanes norvegica TaxID=48144 RepID=A0AAV2QIP5_MEGNR
MSLHKSLVIISISLLVTACALPHYCYYCTNNPGGDDGESDRPYDPTCGDRDYKGSYTYPTSSDRDRCCTIIYANGYISRSLFTNSVEDGGCYHGGSLDKERVDCICTTSSGCNTGSYCEQCDFPFTTLHTTSATTTSQVTTSPPITTITTTADESSTTSQTMYLSCYSCYDCPEVDTNTQVVQGPEISSCVTTILMNSRTHVVIRGDSRDDDIVDGECQQHDEALSCWCTSDLCNDQIVTQLLGLQKDNNIMPEPFLHNSN